jgi:hypothetical protein
MLTVETDVVAVEERLRSGGLACAGCAGVLAGWGRAPARMVRGPNGLVPLTLARRPLGEWSNGSGLAERPVWPMAVVAVRVLAEPGGGMSLVDDQGAVGGSRWMLPTRRSAIALARGVRTGV